MTMTHALTAAAALLAISLGTAALAQEAEPAPEEDAAAGAHAEGATPHYPLEQPHQLDWSFAGPFGRYDPEQLQRGFNVYITVCDSCHGLSMVAFRNLADEGGLHYTEDEARAFAAAQTFPDPASPQGERPGALSDYFPNPFASEADARAANSGALPPDLSLMAKARAVTRGFPTFLFDIVTQYQEGGPNYIYSLLTGYQDPPAGVELPPGQFYNPYFIAGTALAMPPAGQLADGLIAYPQNQDEDAANDVPETVDQYARDVAAFLMWAAEPHLVARKSMGLTVIVFLIILAGLVYYTKKKVWAPLHREEGVA